jgi:hypothetical protein
MKGCRGFSEDTYGFYALGSLFGPERDEIDQHLREGCAVCEEELRQHLRVWSAVGMATPQVQAPRGLRNKIVRSVTTSPPWWRQTIPAWVAALLIVAFGISGWELRRPGAENGGVHPVLPVASVQPLARATPTPAPATAKAPVPEARAPGPILTEPARPVPAPDSTQAQLVASLIDQLTGERDRAAQLEKDLAQQTELVAEARKASQESEQRYQALESSQRRDAGNLQATLAALNGRVRQLEQQISEYRVLLDNQNRRLEQTTRLASLVTDPALRVFRLRGTEQQPGSQGHALIVPGRGAAFFAYRLPALPAGRTYQLWLLRQSGPAIASAGVFTPDQRGGAILEVPNSALLSGVTAFAVTDEPAGGSVQPTGHKWLIGS